MCLLLRLERSIFLGVSSTQHALLLAGIRWYNVDVWSVKRSLVLSPAWWHGTVVLSPAQRHEMLVPPPLPICLPAEGLMKAEGHLVQMANIHQRSNMSNGEGRGESSTGRMKGIGLVRQGRSLRSTSALALSALNAPLFYSQWPTVCMWTVATLHSGTGCWLMLPYCICLNLCCMCVYLGCQHIQIWESSGIS